MARYRAAVGLIQLVVQVTTTSNRFEREAKALALVQYQENKKAVHPTMSSVNRRLDIMMLIEYHQVMRTTLSLDDDVAAKLKSEIKRSGRSFKEVVNEYLRLGLHAKKNHQTKRPFRVKTRDLGDLRPGLSLDNIGELLDQIEGATQR